MECTHCHGYMVNEHFDDLVDENALLCFGAWHWVSRCVKCGNVIDDRINRITPAARLSENDTFASVQTPVSRSHRFQMF